MSSPASPSSTLSSFPSNPSTPPYSDDLEWITAYITIHSLSPPSRRYSFLLWIAVVLIFLAFAVLHWTGSRCGFFGAYWSKWSLPRRTWRKNRSLAAARQPKSLPSNAQLLSLFLLFSASFALAFVGPDYLSPHLRPYVPQYTISKSFWSSAARTGQIAFALSPLCVLFALKAPPFAIFAIPFMIQLFFDKLAWLHRWSGRLIWLLTCIHVGVWSIQLARDRNPTTGRVAYLYAFTYSPFIYGWIAFVILTLIILLSLSPVRRRFYESFYFMHILLVPMMLVTAALHHPAVGWWCWGALALWAGERLWRGTWPSSGNSWEMDCVRNSSVETLSLHRPKNDILKSPPSPLSPYYNNDKSPMSPSTPTPTSPTRLSPAFFHSELDLSRSSISRGYLPPLGYAHAELLSGRTVRLRLITPNFLSWAPGQHFLLNIPSVSRLTSHPFTCASVCDEESPTDEGRTMVFLVRARGGWTQDLWNLVTRLSAEGSPGDAPAALGAPKRGVLLRAYVDGPFGSSKRARWGNYSTGVIITGGSGVSFGLALLQYLCLCLAGRDGRHLGARPGGWGWKGADMKRVRFIWLVREYSHLQWCASIIRRCMSMVPPSALQIDIYVTNFKPVLVLQPPRIPSPPQAHHTDRLSTTDELQPPHPRFARENRTRPRSHSAESEESQETYGSDFTAPAVEALDRGAVHATNILELTNFDGDDDTALPGEARLEPDAPCCSSCYSTASRSRLSLVSEHSTDRLLPSSPLSARDGRWRRQSGIQRYSADGGNPCTPSTSQTELPMPLPSPPNSDVSRSSPVTPDSQTQTQTRTRTQTRFEMDDDEALDVNVVSEHARPGKPKLDKVLTGGGGEGRRGCCGPASLNAMVRKIIAAQIDPARIRRGDMRGSIALVSEEFEY
ncbi:hypothetical protein BU15DRAFT_87038 [Melanogaster broomeanus]|nr:hypothetical protein BU15DRAFT_87038 [Melanogaster broomeanus]